jgi:hypothetical protein
VRGGIHATEELAELVGKQTRLGATHALDSSPDGRAKARLHDRLEQIVDRGVLESADRVLVVCRHEDHCRCALGRGVQHVEAIASRKLHVEEDQVRVEFTNEPDRLRARPRLADQLEVRLEPEQLDDTVTGERFVIHDERAQGPGRDAHGLPGSAGVVDVSGVDRAARPTSNDGYLTCAALRIGVDCSRCSSFCPAWPAAEATPHRLRFPSA